MEFRTDGVRSGETPMYILNSQKWKYLGLTLNKEMQKMKTLSWQKYDA
jgi:hypothetical protein